MSPGEMQRLSFVRLFFHNPPFASMFIFLFPSTTKGICEMSIKGLFEMSTKGISEMSS